MRPVACMYVRVCENDGRSESVSTYTIVETRLRLWQGGGVYIIIKDTLVSRHIPCAQCLVFWDSVYVHTKIHKKGFHVSLSCVCCVCFIRHASATDQRLTFHTHTFRYAQTNQNDIVSSN